MFSRGGSTRRSFRGTQLRVRRPSLLSRIEQSDLLGCTSAGGLNSKGTYISLLSGVHVGSRRVSALCERESECDKRYDLNYGTQLKMLTEKKSRFVGARAGAV